MKRVKIILLYFVLPIFGFAAYVVLQVGLANLDMAIGFTAMVVVAIVFAINTRSGDDRHENSSKRDAEWESYYTMQQSERLHRQHHD